MDEKNSAGNGKEVRAEAAKKPPLRVAAWLIAACLLLLVGSDLIMSRTPYWFYQPWTGPLARQNVKLTCVMRAETAGDLVLVGDSRVRHDFVAAAMEEELMAAGRPRVMNLGLDAAQLIAMREVVDRVMDLPRPPRLVVIGLSAFNMNAHNTRLQRDLRLYARPSMMLRGLVSCPDLSQKWGAVQGLTRGVESIFQLISLKKLGGICKMNEACKGSAYFYPLSSAAMAQNNRAVPYHDGPAMRRAFDTEVSRYRSEYMKDFASGEFTESVCNDMFHLVLARGSQAVIVLMPESPEFRAATPGLGRERAENRIRDLCADNRVTLIDLNQPPYAPPPDAYFDRAVHLNPDPAIELSRKLARDLIAHGMR